MGLACRRAPIGSLLLALALASGMGVDRVVMCGRMYGKWCVWHEVHGVCAVRAPVCLRFACDKNECALVALYSCFRLEARRRDGRWLA